MSILSVGCGGSCAGCACGSLHRDWNHLAWLGDVPQSTDWTMTVRCCREATHVQLQLTTKGEAEFELG